MIRFVVCIDIDEVDVAKAYSELHKYMDVIQKHAPEKWEGWESTDEAFDDDDQIEPDVLQEARDKFFEGDTK